MIPNQWYVVMESREVRTGRVIGLTRMGQKLVAWRDTHGRLSIMADRCPHRGASLGLGKVRTDCIQCPFHGFEYDTTGKCTLVPANGRDAEPPKAMQVQTYTVREQHGFVYLWWGQPRQEYPPLPWFESIGNELAYWTIQDHWNCHYSRAIENQLDVVHLPFVHSSTIGRGNRTLVYGPVTREAACGEGSRLLNLWVHNELDMGQRPTRPSEMPEPDRRPSLQFLFPNLWQNWIADPVRALIAFVPVDDQNTLMYIRYYHAVQAPLARELMGWIGSLANLVIERQDRRVVVTQRPARSDLGLGEILIPGDQPIVVYRKRRRALIEAGSKEHTLDGHPGI